MFSPSLFKMTNDVVALMALLEIKAQTLSVIKNVIIESIFEFYQWS